VSDHVQLPAVVWNGLLQHATEAAPEECCGLLLGRSAEVAEAVRAPNVASDPVRRFQIDPAAHFAAIRRARALGLEVMGAYHSHPRGAPVPSETDRTEAFEDDTFLHVIVAPHLGEMAGYRLISGNFAAVPLVRIR
jgi:proteasome lid subunit RPN8/RPN11